MRADHLLRWLLAAVILHVVAAVQLTTNGQLADVGTLVLDDSTVVVNEYPLDRRFAALTRPGSYVASPHSSLRKSIDQTERMLKAVSKSPRSRSSEKSWRHISAPPVP